MGKKSELVFWKNAVVGVIEEPKVDNFDFYGPWIPTSDLVLYSQFLLEVECEGGADVEIGEIGSPLRGTVELEPSNAIEIKIRG